MPTKPRNESAKTSNEACDSLSDLSESTQCKVDPDHMFGIVGIVGTILNLLVVVLVYIYTPV